jgi:hypothetical protein
MKEKGSLVEINVAAPIKQLDFGLSTWPNPQNLQPGTCSEL